MNKNILTMGLALFTTAAIAQTNRITFHADQRGKAISPDLFGIFFEDINYAADGGLYAELVQNRSFEYSTTEQLAWNSFTAWEFTAREGGRGSVNIADNFSVHPNNPTYAVLDVEQAGGGVGLINSGFDGIAVQAGATYDFSMFARQLFTGRRWGGNGKIEYAARFIVRLESKNGTPLGESSFEISGRDWQRGVTSITATNSDSSARMVLLSMTHGGVAVDEISLFPKATFKGRPNGLRADLAQAISDLRPKFMRFPGGCLVHGAALNNFYRWKDSIGPVEKRRGQANLWGYHQSLGLGYFEYFQFCEDIGAKPLPVVPAGVCCQNADHQGGSGQRGLPLDEMPAFIQDILDLIEWANGPTNSTWGALRAAAGHPAPFNLQYLGVGNEDRITPVFRDRFKLIHDAVRAEHPEITVIGTTGPFHSGEDFDAGWKIANELNVAMVDEHYYEKPEWFLNNLRRYDTYDRAKSKVYVGEYAAHDEKRVNTLRSALAEAAYLTSLERNGDIVHLASYAPLLAKQGRTQWRPDMIYFDNSRLLLSANYHVQRMFGQNQGDIYFSADISPSVTNLSVSCVKDSATGDLIIKLVNVSTNEIRTDLNIRGTQRFKPTAKLSVLAGSPGVNNTFAKPEEITPQHDSIGADSTMNVTLPAHSFSVLRMEAR